MALDEAIAVTVRDGCCPPTLRLYGWDKQSVSLGLFQKATDIDLQYCISNNVPVVRRPTGGRGILHGDELTYSFSAKNEGLFSFNLLETYHKVSIAFKLVFHQIGLRAEMKTERESNRNLTQSSMCFEFTSYGEISFNGKKLIGSAQKRWNDGFLQQGSIPYSVDHEKLSRIFKIKNSRKLEKIDHKTKDYLPKTGVVFETTGLKKLLSDFNPKEFKRHLKLSFEKTFNIRFFDSHPSPNEQELAHLLYFKKYQNLQNP